MPDIVILYNKSNPFGIAKDVKGIEQALIGSGYRTRYADPLEPPMPCDLAIHLEVPVYGWMPWASRNMIMINPEWFETAWIPYMARFDAVLYKDPYSAEEAIQKGYVKREQVRVVPWGCLKPADSEQPAKATGTANTGFVWFLAGSVSKRAYVPTMLGLWRESYPPLRIYSVEPVDCSGLKVPSNVRFEVKDLEPEVRTGLSKFFRGHIGCSKAEGFSYLAAEAEWVGAFTILNDLNCYRADYSDCSGVHILDPNAPDTSLEAAITAFEKADFEEIKGQRRIRAAQRWADFLTNFASAVKEVFKLKVMKPANLPPILLPEACPPISVVTLLYNRRRFVDLACHNIMLTDYPKDKIEWVIVEDSDDPTENAAELITASAVPVRIVYLPLKNKTPVAEKRNLGVARATADIILMMDDDDHYPETSFRRRVAWLTRHPWQPRAVTATTIACYDLLKGISAVNTPPMGIPLGLRISEATLTFYKGWWSERGFPSAVQIGEGEGFISGREQDVLEIPPQQAIVAFSHGVNTSSRRIPSEAEVKPGCFWGFPKEFLVFIHGLAGVKVVEET